MSLTATHRKNVVAPQVYSNKPPENVFLGKMTPFASIVVLDMVPNFQDQEPRLEGSKMRSRPRH